jgi:putative transposase
MRRRRPIQQELGFRTHGGRRAGAGRPKDTARNLLPHTRRPVVTDETPVHVTLRVRPEVWNLRSKRSFRIIERALVAARDWTSARVVHYSVQGNHLHLVTEASDRKVLSRRIQGLEVRIARAMNKLMHRSGSVFADRYHARPLKTPLEARRVIEYVLKNRQHHVPHRAAPFDLRARRPRGSMGGGHRRPPRCKRRRPYDHREAGCCASAGEDTGCCRRERQWRRVAKSSRELEALCSTA